MGLVQPPISFGVLRFFLVAGPRHQGKASVLEIRQIWAISMKFWEGEPYRAICGVGVPLQALHTAYIREYLHLFT